MESINELRHICQLPRKKYDKWYGAYVCRRISIYITRALIPLGISANTVTFIFLVIGLLACVFFSLGYEYWFLVGAILLHIWYLIDHVDGEIARYRNSSSVSGIYFDKMVHYIVHTSYYFCLGWGVYRDLGITLAIAVGYIAGFSMLLITVTNDLKDSTILQKLIFNKKGIVLSNRDEIGNLLESKDKNAIQRIFSFLHNMCTFPNDMNLLTLVIVLKLLFFNRIIYVFLLAYAILATTVWVSRVAFFIFTKKLDCELERFYK